MKKIRLMTTETCCKRAVNAFRSICKNLTEHGFADETDLSFKLKRLNHIINEKKDKYTMRVVSETMCELFSLMLENEKVANFFYEDNFIMDFSTRFRNLNVPYEYKENFSIKLNEFMKKTENDDINVNMIFSIAANAGIFCDEIELSNLKINFYRNLNKLNSASIYLAVINNLISVDRKVLFRLKALCNSVKNTPVAETASLKNPVYVLLNLLQYRCIKSIKIFDDILHDNNMYIMVTNPAAFNAEYFKAQWWKLLTDSDLQEKLARKKKNVALIVDKMRNYRNNCFGNNIIYYDDVINALSDYARLAQ